MRRNNLLLSIPCLLTLACLAVADQPDRLFQDRIAPLLQRNCIGCHNAEKKEGGLALDTVQGLQAGGDSGPVWDAGQPADSALVKVLMPEGDQRPAMPKGRPALSPDEVGWITRWLELGAAWPAKQPLIANEQPDDQWWSLQPLRDPRVPLFGSNLSGSSSDSSVASSSVNSSVIDAFVIDKLQRQGVQAVASASRRELIRRVTMDLTGLPPDLDEIERFEQDSRPDAYQRLVDRLLASPAYGERWARHWLDVVHYGETHGYDKDKLRLNAWPYRDYVIRSFNDDKPYARFVQEQIAGDVLWPDQPDGIEALGFLSAGPWDFIGHVEVPESKLDGRIARHLDRDDMVQNTFLTFQSLTIGCAQCHAHKFDPIAQTEYYGLQAVFAALDRTERKYYRDPQLQSTYVRLQSEQRQLEAEESNLRSAIAKHGGDELVKLDKLIAAAKSATPAYPPEHGYHSAIESKPDVVKWVQVDLGQSRAIAQVEWIACHDDFAGIGDGFGAPVRWKIEASQTADMSEPIGVWDQTGSNYDQPGIRVNRQPLRNVTARYVRFTATQLAMRQNDYIFALAELRVLDDQGHNLAVGKTVTALDSIEAPARWSRSNLVDDKYPHRPDAQGKQLVDLELERTELLQRLVPQETMAQQLAVAARLTGVRKAQSQLPAPSVAYVATIHYGQGNFTGTGPMQGKPRPVQVLPRGDVSKSGPAAVPCALACVGELKPELGAIDSSDAERRAALAEWLSDRRNPLTWRSIVNRIWSYHFLRGIVETPNDFGRMGGEPSHPELLDRLAVDLREHQSLKRLSREIVLSQTYQRSSKATAELVEADPNNRWLARSPRRRLEAEAVRDSMLLVAGLLRREMGGSSYQDFVIEHPEHSPHYEYRLHDPRDPLTMRRSIYRFIARSQTQPLLTSLDCADPSMQVDVRNQSNSATQALSLLNNAFTLMVAEEWADRVSQNNPSHPRATVEKMFAQATGRKPFEDEVQLLTQLAEQHGWTTVARVILNLNEFMYVD